MVGAASFPDAWSRRGSLRLETVVTTVDGQAFAVDVVARGLLAGVLDRVGDVVMGSGGTLFLATNDAGRAGASVTALLLVAIMPDMA